MIDSNSKFWSEYDENGMIRVGGQMQDWDRGGARVYPTGFAKPNMTRREILGLDEPPPAKSDELSAEN